MAQQNSIQGLYNGLINTNIQDFSNKRPGANLIGEPPLIEIFNRGYWGSTLDMVNIERAMLDVRIGIMHRAMDMIREALWQAPPVRTMVYRRVAQVAAAPFDIQAPQDVEGSEAKWAKQIAVMIRRQLRGATGTRGPRNSVSFRDILKYLMWAVVDGRAATQTNFEPVVGDPEMRFALTGFSWIHPSRLAYGSNRELRVIERHTQTGMYCPIGPALEEAPLRFITHRPNLAADYPEYDGLWISMLYYLFFHRYAWRQKMQFIETFIKGWRKVTGPGGIETHVTEASVKEGAARAEELGGETNVWWGAPGVDLSMEWPQGQGYQLIATMPEEVETALARLILGQDKTTTGDTYGKGAEELKGESLLIASDDAETLNQTINRFIERLVALLVSPNAVHLAPQFKFNIGTEKSPDAAQMRLSKAIADGIRVPEKLYRTEVHIPAPENDEAYLVANPSVPGTGKCIDPAKGESEEDLVPPAPEQLGVAAEGGMFDAEQELIGRYRHAFTRQLGKAADAFTAACDKDDWTSVEAALDDARDGIDLSDLSWPIEEIIVRGQMIGIVDAIEDAEADHEPVVAADTNDTLTLDSRRTLSSLVGGFVRKPFAEAVKTFAAKKLVPREMFEDMRGNAKRKAFTIAGLATTHQLKIAKDEVQKALKNGDSPKVFSKRLAERFASAGVTALSTSHAETVIINATMGAFADGRFAQMTQPEVLATRPYWQVQCVCDRNSRHNHKAQHGKVVRGDEVEAAGKRLPWGHRCRCKFVSLTEGQVKVRGLVPLAPTLLSSVPDSGWN